MDDDITSEIDKLLASFLNQKEIDESKANARRLEVENSTTAFLKICDDVIDPAFQEISRHLKFKGIASRISRELPQSVNLVRQGHYSIEISFFTDQPVSDRTQIPRFSVILEQSQNRVRFHQSSITPKRGGTSGSEGGATLDEVSKELIQVKVLGLLKKILI